MALFTGAGFFLSAVLLLPLEGAKYPF